MKENKKYNKITNVSRNTYVTPSPQLNTLFASKIVTFASIVLFLFSTSISLGANQTRISSFYHDVTFLIHIKKEAISMNYRIELITKIEQYYLDQRDSFWEDIRLLAERGTLSEQTCKGLLYQIETPIEKQKDFPNYLHRVPTANQLYAHGPPDVRLGILVESPDLIFGINFDSPLHIIIAGVTGFGKTTAARALQQGVYLYNQRNVDKTKSVIVFDRKANDYGDQPKRFGWLHYNVPDTLRLSLEAPPGVPPNEWINIISTVFCARTNLKAGWVTVANALRWLLAALNPTPTDHLLWPDLNALLYVLKNSPDTLFSSKGEYTRSSITPLEGINQSSGNVFRAFRGFQIERDVVASHKSAVISMPNMFPSWSRQFFTDIILAQLLYGRTYRSHRVDSTEALVIIDEADSDISTEAEEMFLDRMCPVSSCYKTGREFGISICVIISSLRSASRFVLSNATYHFIFRLNDAESIMEASHTLMLPPMGELSLNSLQPGECLVKQIGPWPHAMLGKIDYIPPCRTKPERFDTHPYVPAKNLEELLYVRQLLKETSDKHKKTVSDKKKSQRDIQKLSDNERAFLTHMSLNEFEPLNRLFTRIGNLSPATQQKIIKKLKKIKFIEATQIRTSKSPLRLGQLTNAGWDYIKDKSKYKPLRGGLVHTHVCRWKQTLDIKKGCDESICELQYPNSTGFCDVGTKINGELHCTEVVVDCDCNICDHVKSCFIDSNEVKTLTIVTLLKSEHEKLLEMIVSKPELVFFVNRIRFLTVNEILKEL